MRAKAQAQPDFLAGVHLHACVPAGHPLRAIKPRVDAVLKKLSPGLDELYAEAGRVRLPPGQRRKARVRTAPSSVRRERLFCEQLGDNLRWLWFLTREFHAGSFDPSVFAKNYERVLSAEEAKLFFLAVWVNHLWGWAQGTATCSPPPVPPSWSGQVTALAGAKFLS